MPPLLQEPEYIIADFVNTLAAEALMRVQVLGPTSQSPLEITHPEDTSIMAAALISNGML